MPAPPCVSIAADVTRHTSTAGHTFKSFISAGCDAEPLNAGPRRVVRRLLNLIECSCCTSREGVIEEAIILGGRVAEAEQRIAEELDKIYAEG